MLDFFGGSDVSTRVAIEEGRHSVSCDNSQSFACYGGQQSGNIRSDLISPIPDHEISEKLDLSHSLFEDMTP